MPALATGRIINGVVYSSSSIVITANNKPYSSITEISYSDSLEPGILQGTGTYMEGRTTGQYKAEASMTIGKLSFENLKLSIAAMNAGGIYKATFLITVTYRASATDPVIVDNIEGCRIMKQENSHSAGNSDALVAKVDLSVFRIKWNGLYAVNDEGIAGSLIGA